MTTSEERYRSQVYSKLVRFCRSRRSQEYSCKAGGCIMRESQPFVCRLDFYKEPRSTVEKAEVLIDNLEY